MELTSGSSLSRYTIGDKLGAGGMGVVYRAFDTRLERPVALKVLPPAAIGDAARRERFVREAKAASALNHPSIVTVFDIDRVATAGGEIDLLAMELVDGEPLDRALAAGPLPVARALELAVALADALAAAHRAGIVHRDVKPGNLMVTASGQLKLLDFGLARNLPGVNVDPTAATVPDGLTATGAVVGTPAYMSPEQATGKPVDARTDVFAAGAVVYEMLAGRRPFVGDTPMAQLLAVLHDAPAPLRAARADTPPELERIVLRCLEKDPTRRYPSAAELHAELVALRARLFAPAASPLAALRRPAVALPLAVLLAASVAGAAWWLRRASALRQARAELGRLAELVERREFVPAWLLARQLAPVLGDDRELERLVQASTRSYSVRSEPEGAQIEFRSYLDDPNAWHSLGTAPIDAARLPATALLFRARLPGHVEVEGLPATGESGVSFALAFELWPESDAHRGFVRVPAGRGGFDVEGLELPAFWIGRHEVTNREYQAFVDAGGYRDRSHWREPFVRDGREIGWDEAMATLVDATGRSGPATWRLGSFPEGEADLPVAGVSWYEAAAYAAWAGGTLPTLHHWFRAAAPDVFSEILQRSNFGRRGPVAVGSTAAPSAYGAADMAGNVFEWTATGDGEGRRYLAGGSWNEPSYSFVEPGAVSPWDREASRGLRLARYEAPAPPEAFAPVRVDIPDFTGRSPADDALFAAFRGFYVYDRAPLEARTESVDDASPHFRWERVSYAAAYGGERIPAHLLLPRNAAPPYQVVVYFPPSPAERLTSSQSLDGLPSFDFFVRSGRAVLFPVYQNTYERRIPGWQWSPAARRDVVIQWSKDLGRSLDYLESRDDLDAERVAFYGVSLGSVYGPVLLAVEPRLRAAIFLGGGFNVSPLLPESDPFHFAPRVKTPTLMLTGRDDFVRPVATHQLPMLRLLGPPEEQKKLVALDGGHIPSDLNEAIREALAWLDRWLGPVATRRPAAGGD